MANSYAGHSSCGACEGTSVLTPDAPNNASGLYRVDFRAGEHNAFYQSMVARLSSSKYGALGTLTSRDSQDFTLALIDAWAASCDVLTFYSEQWLNEAYLRTAQENTSLHEMAALIDYVPHPGAAATADLAFKIAAGEGIPELITIPAGTKVQSTPGQDETPVIYETLDDLPARAAWNAIRPKLTAPHPLTITTTRLPFEGTNTRLKAGDAVFFYADDGTAVFGVVNAVTPVIADIANDTDAKDLTWVTVSPLASEPVSLPGSAAAIAVPKVLVGVAEEHSDKAMDAAELVEVLEKENVEEKAFFAQLIEMSSADKKVLVFRASAAIFGNAAPPLSSLHHSLTGSVPVYTENSSGVVVEGIEPGPYADETENTWADGGSLQLMDEGGNEIFLDRPVAEIAVGSDIVLRNGEQWARYRVEDAADLSVSFFAVTGKSTRLTLDRSQHFNRFAIRKTTAFCASEWLTLAEPPIESPLDENTTTVLLNGWYPGLEAGRTVMLHGLAEGFGDEPEIATRTVQTVTHDLTLGAGTELIFTETIGAPYLPQSLRIAANIAYATQGETVAEVLGDGAAMPHMHFITKQAPQTFVPAETATGVKPTLEVRVNNILWHPVPHFLHASPSDRVYTSRVDEEGYSHIAFGDGVLGVKPGNGQQNIRARYRKTHGLMGRVKAGQLNLLMSQPLGVESVKNLLHADGGADPEGKEAIRLSAPLSCRTLGRVVSLTNYADFAQGFGGIAKASSQWLHLPTGPQVIVSVAAEEGATVPEGSDLHTTLSDALTAAGDPFARFLLRSYRQTFFKLGVRLQIHPDYLPDEVARAAESALRQALSFYARQFGQPVFASEIIAILHEIDGIDAVVIDRLYSGATPERRDGLAAPMAEWLGDDVVGASILSLHPAPLDYLETSL
ncbi:hypothetical protein [Enterovibrio norvegicus]|uniref:Baseplate protein J-like domain-containing protein n=1 Tax=Enterovibrio norvegicus TaxID=188144 RepID=A0A2N7L736_9GAMM|nr:hypothetical protein [Enterovibrio norvegicus]PMN89786.1 hypothetical protein BCT23_21990 [Enterovibrio norvegicus]